MKIKDLTNTKGVYVACRIEQKSNALINDFIKEFSIPDYSDNKIEQRKHVTIIYSTMYDYIKPLKYQYLAFVSGYDIFSSKNDEKCLVMKLNCPDILKRHRDLMSSHKLNYSFPIYNPHITLSYSIKDFDWQKLPIFGKPIILQNEYTEELKN